MNKPNISPIAFWDVNFEKLDFQNHSDYIILKVCQRGMDSDFVEIMQFYGKDKVKSVIDQRMLDIYNLPRANLFIMHEVKVLKARLEELKQTL